MDNELHAVERSKKKIIVSSGLGEELDGLLELFSCYRDVYDVGRMPFTPLRRKKPSQPPSEKPIELRDEHDLARLRKAEEKRLKRQAKRRTR